MKAQLQERRHHEVQGGASDREARVTHNRKKLTSLLGGGGCSGLLGGGASGRKGGGASGLDSAMEGAGGRVGGADVCCAGRTSTKLSGIIPVRSPRRT